MHFSSPFRSASEWRIGQMGNGFHARRGTHTVVLSEREDGAKIRAVSMVAGTALFGSISTVLTVLSWICVGIHSRRALPSPACA